jgi:hypothetical protein
LNKIEGNAVLNPHNHGDYAYAPWRLITSPNDRKARIVSPNGHLMLGVVIDASGLEIVYGNLHTNVEGAGAEPSEQDYLVLKSMTELCISALLDDEHTL